MHETNLVEIVNISCTAVLGTVLGMDAELDTRYKVHAGYVPLD